MDNGLMKNGLAAAVAAGLSLWAAQASAGAFVGVSVGQGTVDGDLDEFNDVTIDTPFNFDEDDTAYKVFGGYMFNEFVGVEVGYVDFGEPNANFSDVSLDGGEGTASGKLEGEFTGWTLALLGQFPLGPVDVFGKIGMVSYDAEISASGTVSFGGPTETFSDSFKDDGEELMYGAGVKLNLGPVGIRLEYEIYDVNDVDVELWSLGAQINF
jgi:opacity protein-like surface antigen